MSPAHRLAGRHILVIGATRGIGASIAERLGQEGATVACGGRSVEAAAEAAHRVEQEGGTGLPVITDLEDRSTIDAAIAEAVAAHGPLDGLVQSGAVTATTPFLDVPPEEWDWVLRTNATGTFHACQAFGRHLRDHQRPGSIVVVTSQLAEVAIPNKTPYVASKGAMRGLIRAMALDLAPHDVRVNGLAPGVTRTDMAMDRLSEDREAMAWTTSRIPMGRLGEPEEMGGAAAFLLSDDASYMTGSTLVVDGGYLAW